jgi:hypothetical protein
VSKRGRIKEMRRAKWGNEVGTKKGRMLQKRGLEKAGKESKLKEGTT